MGRPIDCEVDAFEVNSSADVIRVFTEDLPEEFQLLRRMSLPASVWFDVLDALPDMTHAVTLNKHLPPEVLVRLSHDEDPMIRSSVLSMKGFPLGELERLSRDPDIGVRGAVARRPNLPEALRERLIADEDWWVRRQALGALPEWGHGLAEQVYGADQREMREILALLPQLDESQVLMVENSIDDYEVPLAVLVAARRVQESGQRPEPAVRERLLHLAERVGAFDYERVRDFEQWSRDVSS